MSHNPDDELRKIIAAADRILELVKDVKSEAQDQLAHRQLTRVYSFQNQPKDQLAAGKFHRRHARVEKGYREDVIGAHVQKYEDLREAGLFDGEIPPMIRGSALMSEYKNFKQATSEIIDEKD